MTRVYIRTLLGAGAVFASVAGPAAVQAVAPFPLGVYVGNANGNDPKAMADFKAAFDAHNAKMGGVRPKFFNVFTDFGKDPSTWPKNAAWGAWSSAKSGDAYLGPGSGMIPLVGVPLATNSGGWSKVDTFYLDTIAGKYDAAWAGIVDGWAGAGYKVIDFRIAYEMNGNFMPWAPGNSKAPNARQDFVKAFQHVADILHREAKAKGAQAFVHWNPAGISYTGYDITLLYPGDAYVDVISADQYSPMYPRDLTDWAHGGKTRLTDKAAWAADPLNREHFWRQPNGSFNEPNPKIGAWGWSVPMTIQFAKQHGKPMAIDETGAGPSGSGLGPHDDPEFPRVLAAILHDAQAQGVTVRNVNIWDAKLGDGDWDFRGGSKPLAAAAWAKYFGSGGSAVPYTPPPAPAASPARPTARSAAVTPPRASGKMSVVVGQSLAAPGKIVLVRGGSDLSSWAKASPAAPIRVKVGGHDYLVVGAGNGRLIFSTPVAPADAKWGSTIVGN